MKTGQMLQTSQLLAITGNVLTGPLTAAALYQMQHHCERVGCDFCVLCGLLILFFTFTPQVWTLSPCRVAGRGFNSLLPGRRYWRLNAAGGGNRWENALESAEWIRVRVVSPRGDKGNGGMKKSGQCFQLLPRG